MVSSCFYASLGVEFDDDDDDDDDDDESSCINMNFD